MYSLGTNSWTDPDFGPVPEHQKIERIKILAYLEADEIQVPIDVIIRNDDLYDVDLKGWSVRDFNSLETDVKDALDKRKNELVFSYFDKPKTKSI